MGGIYLADGNIVKLDFDGPVKTFCVRITKENIFVVPSIPIGYTSWSICFASWSTS